MGRALFCFLLILLSAQLCSAYSIQNLDTRFVVFESNVVVETEILLLEPVSQLEWAVPEDANAISVYADGKAENFTKSDSRIIIPSDGKKNISFNYVSSDFIENENFLLSFTAPAYVQNLKFTVILPEEATLKKPLVEDTITSGSVYPKPDSATTDGRSLIFAWEKSNVRAGDGFSIFVSYGLRKSYGLLMAVLVVLMGVLFAAALYVFLKKPKVIQKIVKESDIEKHLKEDEEVIVNVLKKRLNQQIEQGTLRIVTGYSKASLSRLLKELEERKVIKKEKRGKKNLIFLK
jgi:uncharacterized membrane protein